MWRLLLTECAYYRTTGFIAGLLCLTGCIGVIFLGGNEPAESLRAFRVMMVFCIGLLWLRHSIAIQKEGADRFRRLLPVRSISVGIVRVLLTGAFWCALMIVYAGVRIITNGSIRVPGLCGEVAAFSGFFLLGIGLTLIFRDHRYCGWRPLWRRIVGGHRLFVHYFRLSAFHTSGSASGRTGIVSAAAD